jgi:hypothetical protein
MMNLKDLEKQEQPKFKLLEGKKYKNDSRNKSNRIN